MTGIMIAHSARAIVDSYVLYTCVGLVPALYICWRIRNADTEVRAVIRKLLIAIVFAPAIEGSRIGPIPAWFYVVFGLLNGRLSPAFASLLSIMLVWGILLTGWLLFERRKDREHWEKEVGQ